MFLHVYLVDEVDPNTRQGDIVYWGRTSHANNMMAYEGGAYECIWHPTKLGIRQASALSYRLDRMVATMDHDPDRFLWYEIDPDCGGSNFDNFRAFLREYSDACKKHPDAEVRVKG